jgi:hypothetical protein
MIQAKGLTSLHTQYYDFQHNDSQHSDFQYNDIQHNDSQQNDIQHNNKLNATLSIVMLNVTYAECHLC